MIVNVFKNTKFYFFLFWTMTKKEILSKEVSTRKNLFLFIVKDINYEIGGGPGGLLTGSYERELNSIFNIDLKF